MNINLDKLPEHKKQLLLKIQEDIIKENSYLINKINNVEKRLEIEYNTERIINRYKEKQEPIVIYDSENDMYKELIGANVIKSKFNEGVEINFKWKAIAIKFNKEEKDKYEVSIDNIFNNK